ncbi:hypothetical protein [Chryseobacterium koreense]|uniref:hypothetical protein n=1 Tax=Chryseobacterium koreense TaxID=232216 RepID=UPI0026E994A6|nr:hypothetical protein [Chryseobacterium koreense]
MKKSFFTICLLLSGVMMVLAQTGTILGSQIRIAEKKAGKYVGWTTDWIELSGNDRPILEITADTLVDAGTKYFVYYIKFTYEGETTEGTYVYDSGKSEAVRKEWNKKVVNCYVDEEGDYIYVEDISLQQLAKDSNTWAKYPNSTIQFINKDMNIAFK